MAKTKDLQSSQAGDRDPRNPIAYDRITTARLELIAATSDLLRIELADRSLFAKMLDAIVPESWPPELYDREAAEWTINYLDEDPDRAGWGLWYCILLKEPPGKRILGGIAGYKGAPSPDGQVEIGYGMLKEFRRAGYATEAASALIERAFSIPQIGTIIAETYPELSASIGVLRKNGFELAGPGSEDRVIRFALPRSSYERRRHTAT
jgi:[ribosomal protein S5]-alanine N-acetyltransferase